MAPSGVHAATEVVEYVHTVALEVAPASAHMVVEPMLKMLMTGVLVAKAAPPLFKVSWKESVWLVVIKVDEALLLEEVVAFDNVTVAAEALRGKIMKTETVQNAMKRRTASTFVRSPIDDDRIMIDV